MEKEDLLVKKMVVLEETEEHLMFNTHLELILEELMEEVEPKDLLVKLHLMALMEVLCRIPVLLI